MSLIISQPSGPIRPVIEALYDIEILGGFVRSLEASAANQLRDLGRASLEVSPDGHDVFRVFHGLDGSTWHLETLFADYFPNLQRTAAFLVVWSCFEHHLNDLCFEVASAEKLSLLVKDLKGTGVIRACTYLQDVARLPLDLSDSQWRDELVPLQKLRGFLAHTDAHLQDHHKAERAYAEASDFIEVSDGTLKLSVDFIGHVLKNQAGWLRILQVVVTDSYSNGA